MEGTADPTDIVVSLGTAILIAAVFAPITFRLYYTRG